MRYIKLLTSISEKSGHVRDDFGNFTLVQNELEGVLKDSCMFLKYN